MGAGLFLIAIMGCADGSAACTPVATMPTRYESRAAVTPASVDRQAPAKRPAALPIGAQHG